MTYTGFMQSAFEGKCGFCGKQGQLFQTWLPIDYSRTDHVGQHVPRQQYATKNGEYIITKIPDDELRVWHSNKCPGCVESTCHAVCATLSSDCNARLKQERNRRHDTQRLRKEEDARIITELLNKERGVE